MSDDTFGGVIGLVLIGVFFYFATSPNWSYTKHTVYYEACSDYVPISKCQTGLGLGYQTYAVYPEAEMVVTKDLYKIKGCAIFDEENWSCPTVQVIDGFAIYTDQDNNDPHFKPITRIYYYYQYCVNLLQYLKAKK